MFGRSYAGKRRYHPERAPVAFKDHGVYLITGGLGGLGLLFAKEIIAGPAGQSCPDGARSANAEKQNLLDGLSASAGRVSYRQVDLGDLDQVMQLIAAIRDEHGQLNGILHCAGMIADNFILKKTDVEFSEVLVPKVTGTYNLDEASRISSSISSCCFLPSPAPWEMSGQADYAAANGFMDQFAAYRNRQVAASNGTAARGRSTGRYGKPAE